ncbi:MAG: Xaa-Pro peptidase family protein [Candidatus Freyarchaeum deiterrae]
MNVPINYWKRVENVRAAMEGSGFDVLVLTRNKELTYISGAFLPWRSVMVVPLDGEIQLYTVLSDAERIKDDSWIENVSTYTPIPGLSWTNQVIAYLKEHNLAKSNIGVNLGYTIRVNEGYLFASEYEELKNGLPDAVFKNAVQTLDEVIVIKEKGAIKLLRQAAAIADVGVDVARGTIIPGMNETELVGIVEEAMRRAGSQWAWALTGGHEVGSGNRATYHMGATTPATKRIIQHGDNVVVDLHSMYELHLSQVTHNIIVGNPTIEQRKLAEVYVEAASILIDSMQPGVKVRDIANKVFKTFEKAGYGNNVVQIFGHGLGSIGDEWYLPIINYGPYGEKTLEPNMIEVAVCIISKPGVAGYRLEYPVLITKNGNEPLAKTPIEPTIL